jgi:hypothetical protein
MLEGPPLVCIAAPDASSADYEIGVNHMLDAM